MNRLSKGAKNEFSHKKPLRLGATLDPSCVSCLDSKIFGAKTFIKEVEMRKSMDD